MSAPLFPSLVGEKRATLRALRTSSWWEFRFLFVLQPPDQLCMLTRLLPSLRAARLPRQPSRALLSATPFWHRTAAPSVAQPAMLLRPPAVTPAPPIAGASRQRSQKQSNKLRQKRMAHPRRSKRDAMARRGIKPQQPLPDWKWGIFARDEVAVYHGKRKMGQGKVLRVDHARSRVWVEGIKLREFATEESANDPDPSRCAA